MAVNNAVNIPLPIPVADNGTGASSFTDGAVLVGSGTAAITALSAGSTGELLVGATTADPAFGTSADANFTFTSATAAVNRTVTVSNTDNTNTASSATVAVSVGGITTTGDPALLFTVTGTTDWRIGSDNSSSDQLLLNSATTFTTANPLEFFTTGEHIKPLQPAFYGYLGSAQANVTGDGTQATLSGLTEEFDQNNDFSTATFTAPKAGIYLIRSTMRMSVDAAMTGSITSLKTTGYVFRASYCGPGAVRSAFNQKSVMAVSVASMAASDTVTATVTYSGGTKISDIQAADDVTNFSVTKVA